MFSIRLPADVDKRLKFLAEKTRRPKSFYILEALTSKYSLEDLEDIYLADVAYEEWARGGKKTLSLDEMEKSLGLES